MIHAPPVKEALIKILAISILTYKLLQCTANFILS